MDLSKVIFKNPLSLTSLRSSVGINDMNEMNEIKDPLLPETIKELMLTDNKSPK